jgi:hypothetical protein
MDLKFIEAGNGFNWGKFAVGRFTQKEWETPAACQGAHEPSLIAGRGWTQRHVWVLDLQTGEGAAFLLGGLASADLTRHRIWVCPLFEYFLEWLYQYTPAHPEQEGAWMAELPSLVALPDALGDLYGYRREGKGIPVKSGALIAGTNAYREAMLADPHSQREALNQAMLAAVRYG